MVPRLRMTACIDVNSRIPLREFLLKQVLLKVNKTDLKNKDWKPLKKGRTVSFP